MTNRLKKTVIARRHDEAISIQAWIVSFLATSGQ
jgi:hypothetical protein